MIDDGAFVPVRAHSVDAGLDLLSPVDTIIPETGRNWWGDVNVGSHVIDTGVHVEIPEGYVGMVKSKSGLNVKHGIISEGVIDAGYTGSIVVKLYNLSDVPYHIGIGDKIAQLVIVPIITPCMELVDSFPETERGANGFGSTGK
jgi:dUTP pyrophosphatase